MLFWCGKSGIDSKSLRAFFTPLGQPKVCPNRLGRRLVEGGSRPYGQSELKIKKATSFEAAFSILVADRTGKIQKASKLFSPLRGAQFHCASKACLAN